MALFRPLVLLCGGILLFQFACQNSGSKPPYQSGAGRSLDEWATRRMDAQGVINQTAFSETFLEVAAIRAVRGGDPLWRSLGPHNVGGRTLCVAFHPQDANTVFVGSASGGLWRSDTSGKGEEAWRRVDTGYPVLGVSSILIDPDDPDMMWIGTGEMYSNGVVRPGTVNRFTRGTYGIGILKSEDGGQNWSYSLDWSQGKMRGVQKLAMNPLRNQTLFAATSEGLLRSYDAGDGWHSILELPMVVDIYVHPVDTQILLVSTGSYYTDQAGLYRSIDGGTTFTLIEDGIPSGYTGKTRLAPDPAIPDRVYASVADALQGLGLYQSNDAGMTWSMINGTNFPQFQGWYSHAVAVNPTDNNELLAGGIDLFRSPNAGAILVQAGIWETGALGKIKAGGPEGPPFYVHADIHDIVYHPLHPGEAWIATDGGLFVTNDGQNFEGRNGGYQTQQFYARFSVSRQNALLGLGGLQDNGTVMYEGDKEWVKVIKGDGMHTAIHPVDDSRMLASTQNLNLFRSLNGGNSFDPAGLSLPFGELRAFNGAFTLDPNHPERVLAGGQRLYRSNDFSAPGSWTPLADENVDEDNIITTIRVAPGNSNHIVVATVSDPILSNGVNTGGILVSKQGGAAHSWQMATGLPTAMCTSVSFHPFSADTLLATFGGYGNPHLYRSTDGGISWTAWGDALPDLPTNTVTFDPNEPQHVYIGNDLSVWFSDDGGQSWTWWGDGLPEACLVMDLTINKPAHELWVATHGNGVYAAPLQSQPVHVRKPSASPAHFSMELWPNPVQDVAHVRLDSGNSGEGKVLEVWTLDGRPVASFPLADRVNYFSFPVTNLPKGVYLITLRTRSGPVGGSLRFMVG